MTLKTGNLPPIRITVEIPSQLALAMQQAAIAGTIEGASTAQVNLMNAWMGIGAQVMGAFQKSYADAMHLPPPR